MRALEVAKGMGRKRILEEIKKSNLLEYGIGEDSLWTVFNHAKEESGWEKKDTEIIVALNNADTEGVLLELLKSNPDKVMEGISIAAYALNAGKKMLYIPEYAGYIAETEEIKIAAQKYEVTLFKGLVDMRKVQKTVLFHIVSAVELVEVFEGTYEAGVYVSVNGGALKKISRNTKIQELADMKKAKILQTGYQYIQAKEDLTVGEVQIKNGVFRVLSEKECIVAETEKCLAAYEKQSCGKCVFCREGLKQLRYMQKEILEGRGKPEFFELTREIGEAMKISGYCSMGQVASEIALTAIRLLATEYQIHIKKKKCPAGICFSSDVMYIDPILCEGCGECMAVCPKDCIEGKVKYIHMIDDMECDKCGKCIEVCGKQAIIKTNGKIPKLPDRLTKVGRLKKRG